jgi:DivIVA domain-containing protein
VLHLVLYALLAVLLAAGLFALAARFLPAGEQIAPPLRDEPPWELPIERPLRPEDVDGVRLPVALRGYRFAETDLLLDRLAAELRARDEEIARLRGVGPAPEPSRTAPPAAHYDGPAADVAAGEAAGGEPAAQDAPVEAGADQPVSDEPGAPGTDEAETPRHGPDDRP